MSWKWLIWSSLGIQAAVLKVLNVHSIWQILMWNVLHIDGSHWSFLPAKMLHILMMYVPKNMYSWIWSNKRGIKLQLREALVGSVLSRCKQSEFEDIVRKSYKKILIFNFLIATSSVLTYLSALFSPSVLVWEGSQMLLVDSDFDGNRTDTGKNRDL